jgi:hypothetical protein
MLSQSKKIDEKLQSFLEFLMMKTWQIPLKKTPNKKMRVKGTKREDPSPIQKNKTQSGSLNGKGTNHVPKPPLVARSTHTHTHTHIYIYIYENLERVVNLEKPSPKMTNTFQNKGNVGSLQGYCHPLLIQKHAKQLKEVHQCPLLTT